MPNGCSQEKDALRLDWGILKLLGCGAKRSGLTNTDDLPGLTFGRRRGGARAFQRQQITRPLPASVEQAPSFYRAPGVKRPASPVLGDRRSLPENTQFLKAGKAD